MKNTKLGSVQIYYSAYNKAAGLEKNKLTSTQTLWNQRGHRSQPTHDNRADLFFPRGGSSALHTAQISFTCSSAGSATSPLVDGCGNCGGGCNGWSLIVISYCSATPTKAMPTN